ncbi:MAG: AbrB/MazE/SpoVT family DNA-binding domain-containing protein [Euryarchaeota archaeon]|nr:AbrB/MazE/SpoVT family DNA-binding domain-containing protein [Euryarchaeota archaeon]
MIAKVKRWGNSLGLVVPAPVVREHGLRDGDVVEVEIRRRIPHPHELAGTVKFRTPLHVLLREMEEGWEDR